MKKSAVGTTVHIANSGDDDKELEALGYVPSFKREFSNLATISFAFSIMGLCSSIATTFNTPLLLGGPASVTWCWIIGTCMCFTLGTSIAEIVSAFPTCGGLYTASAKLCPKYMRARVGYVVGWLSILGQIAGVSSSEFGVANMIWSAVVLVKPDYNVNAYKTVGLFIGLLGVHGLLNSLATRHLARFTSSFVFINLGATVLIIIVLLATTPRSEMHSGSYVFGSEGIVNQTGGWNTGIAFLFGLSNGRQVPRFDSAHMTDYDATAHISEEVRRAAYAAPVAIVVAIIGTGLLGWLLNIVLILCSGPLSVLQAAPELAGSTFLTIMAIRMGNAGALVLWALVCLNAFCGVQTALQAVSRTMFAFSRDHGLPDGGFLSYNSTWTMTPLRAIWACTFLSVIPGLLDLASPIAANAVFALTAMALDLSRRWYRNHPEVNFKPGPFYLGDGLLGWVFNINCILWTLFVIIILSMPTYMPVTKDNMNYASVITVGVVVIAGFWYMVSAHKHYQGPISNLPAGGKEENTSESVSNEELDREDTV
ncbi:hypothetical protein HWV62_29521 [Athelia sp. TMB]|nr:hypothetical protein HWV62_29521 [Athelia sp. TMB]